jgi:hypothetical protein
MARTVVMETMEDRFNGRGFRVAEALEQVYAGTWQGVIPEEIPYNRRGNSLKAAMLRAGVTPHRLASRIGQTRQAVYQYRDGVRRPSDDMIARIRVVLEDLGRQRNPSFTCPEAEELFGPVVFVERGGYRGRREP